MKALRVLRLTRNKIENVPTCLKDLNSLCILKISGNPLRSEIASLIEGKDGSPPLGGGVIEQERDRILTESMKDFLRGKAVAEEPEGRSRYLRSAVPRQAEANVSFSSEDQPNTPRPLMRDGSVRFPVKPSHSGSESASETPSPGYIKSTFPVRSHYRVVSGQNHIPQASALRRPGLTPLISSNERNRSNSESILQASQTVRNKRMGMVTKKNTDLRSLEESRQNWRNSHLRGQSHGSVLRNRNHDGSVNGGYQSPNARDILPPLNAYVNRLSSLPEHKAMSRSSRMFDSKTKAVFQAVPLLYPVIRSFTVMVPDRLTRKTTLERAYQHARLQLEELDAALSSNVFHQQIFSRPSNAGMLIQQLTNRACTATVSNCLYLGKFIYEQFVLTISNRESTQLRMTILSAYASAAENRIVCLGSQKISYKEHHQNVKQKLSTRQRNGRSSRVPFVRKQRHSRHEAVPSPTLEHPVTARRLKNGFKTPTLANGYASRQSKPNGHPAVSSYRNGRSRSNSRADTYNLPSSTSTYFAMTPSSTGQPSLPGTPLNRSRSSSVAAGFYGDKWTPTNDHLLNSGLEAQFQGIWRLLDQCVVQGRNIVPWLRDCFHKSLEIAQLQEHHNQRVYALWTRLIGHCDGCLGMLEKLSRRIGSLKPQESQATRYDRNFWQISQKTLDSLGNLLQGIKDAKKLDLVNLETVHRVLPLSKTIQLAAHEIHNSPWMDIVKESEQSLQQPSSNTQTSYSSAASGHRYRRSSGSNASAIMSVPATPLSAALGPAAQATVPSPLATGSLASASLERSFHGGLWERADALLSQQSQQQQQQQTMIYRR